MTTFFYPVIRGNSNTHSQGAPGGDLKRTDGGRMGVEQDSTTRDIDDDHSSLDELVDLMAAGDSLIVACLADLGIGADAIRSRIKSLAHRSISVIVKEIGNVDITLPENDLVLKTLDALANEMRSHPAAGSGTELVRRRRRTPACRDIEKYRTSIVTEYSLGESVSALVRKYGFPRSRIVHLLSRTHQHDIPKPTAFGD